MQSNNKEQHHFECPFISKSIHNYGTSKDDICGEKSYLYAISSRGNRFFSAVNMLCLGLIKMAT